MTQSLPAETKANTIRTYLERPEFVAQLKRAVPKHVDVDRLLRVAMTSIRTTPKLLECTPQSLMASVMGCVTLGLETEPTLGQAYLVPYWNSRNKCFEAQLIPGYRGYISLARRSGEVQSISTQVVYNNDFFELQFGLEEKMNHIPAEGDRGEVKGAYVVFRYKDGSHSFDYMPKEDIDKIRTRSKAGEKGPWVTDYPEMAKKTVIRRHVKVAPLSVELARAAASEDMALGGESQVDFFLPGNGGAPKIEAPASTVEDFDRLAGGMIDYPPDQTLNGFLSLTAKANNVSIDALKIQAVPDFESFWQAFEMYMKDRADQSMAGAGNEPTGRTLGQQPSAKFACEHCDKVFDTERGKKKHVTQQHRTPEAPLDENPDPPNLDDALDHHKGCFPNIDPALFVGKNGEISHTFNNLLTLLHSKKAQAVWDRDFAHKDIPEQSMITQAVAYIQNQISRETLGNHEGDRPQ